jgi:hypothetical protein
MFHFSRDALRGAAKRSTTSSSSLSSLSSSCVGRVSRLASMKHTMTHTATHDKKTRPKSHTTTQQQQPYTSSSSSSSSSSSLVHTGRTIRHGTQSGQLRYVSSTQQQRQYSNSSSSRHSHSTHTRSSYSNSRRSYTSSGSGTGTGTGGATAAAAVLGAVGLLVGSAAAQGRDTSNLTDEEKHALLQVAMRRSHERHQGTARAPSDDTGYANTEAEAEDEENEDSSSGGEERSGSGSRSRSRPHTRTGTRTHTGDSNVYDDEGEYEAEQGSVFTTNSGKKSSKLQSLFHDDAARVQERYDELSESDKVFEAQRTKHAGDPGTSLTMSEELIDYYQRSDLERGPEKSRTIEKLREERVPLDGSLPHPGSTDALKGKVSGAESMIDFWDGIRLGINMQHMNNQVKNMNSTHKFMWVPSSGEPESSGSNAPWYQFNTALMEPTGQSVAFYDTNGTFQAQLAMMGQSVPLQTTGIVVATPEYQMAALQSALYGPSWTVGVGAMLSNAEGWVFSSNYAKTMTPDIYTGIDFQWAPYIQHIAYSAVATMYADNDHDEYGISIDPSQSIANICYTRRMTEKLKFGASLKYNWGKHETDYLFSYSFVGKQWSHSMNIKSLKEFGSKIELPIDESTNLSICAQVDRRVFNTFKLGFDLTFGMDISSDRNWEWQVEKAWDDMQQQ